MFSLSHALPSLSSSVLVMNVQPEKSLEIFQSLLVTILIRSMLNVLV